MVLSDESAIVVRDKFACAYVRFLFSEFNVTAALKRFAYGKDHVSRQETFPKRRQLEFLQNAVQFSVKIPFLINANSVVAHQAILQMI